jgi:hypothetical protein
VKIINCKQGSPEWHAARLGIPTASNFGRIVTPGGKPSSQAEAYMHRLVAERLVGLPMDDESSQWMERGQITEAQAVAYYELHRGLDTEAVGFVTTDDGAAGCSPDRLVGADGELEIKCPSAPVHVGYLLEVEPRKYWPQIQGQLWITGRKWCDFLSYCPGLPPALVRYERDEEFIKALSGAVVTFAQYVDAAHQRLAAIVGREAA